MPSRNARWLISILFVLPFCGVVATPCARAETAKSERITRKDLVGTWRLVRIEYSGAHGATVDPFYGSASTGMLIYDRSGSMSVQIVGALRPAMTVPDSRPSPPEVALHDALKNAAALDTYMGYFGTWMVDEATATVIHKVESSLIPDESGLTYSQSVSLEGTRLVFTNRNESGGEVSVRRKIWERVPGSGETCAGQTTQIPRS